MDIFSPSSLPLTSARAVRFRAGGPVGMSIMVNHSMGSAESHVVRAANRYMNEIEIL